MNIINFHQSFIENYGQKICTDSRNVELGSIFFALRGEQFNGNEYAQDALDKGCALAIVDDPKLTGEKFLLVENVYEFLKNLATHHRRTFNIPIIGITGSNGKTTTKELMNSVLSQQKKVVATKGNLNNHIGVPLTLLRITNDTDIAIIEMGANRIGDIKDLCEIAEPTDGIITNIGRAHLGYFGGVGAVIEAKTEMYRFVQKHGGHIFVNASDELLLKYAQGIDKTLYGSSVNNEFKVVSQKTSPYVSVVWGCDTKIQSKLTGEYNIENIACAIAVGIYFNIQHEQIVTGIESYTPNNSRSEMITTEKGNTIIKDYYNANSSSIIAALENIKVLRKPNQDTIVILGDMFELGEYSEEEHKMVLQKAHELAPDRLIVVGKDFRSVSGDTDESYLNVDECIAKLSKEDISNSLILIKGSNGMHLGKILEAIKL